MSTILQFFKSWFVSCSAFWLDGSLGMPYAHITRPFSSTESSHPSLLPEPTEWMVGGQMWCYTMSWYYVQVRTWSCHQHVSQHTGNLDFFFLKCWYSYIMLSDFHKVLFRIGKAPTISIQYQWVPPPTHAHTPGNNSLGWLIQWHHSQVFTQT